jgi:hydroxymethylpyrimidine pyrophosphatase-like HAD family hydrolase
VLDSLDLRHGWAVCSNGSVTLRLDPSFETGYEIADSVTFDPTPILTLLRRHLPTALYAVEETGVGYRLTAPFPEGELSGEQTYVAFEDLLHRPAARVVVRAPDQTSESFSELVRRIGLHGVNYAVGWTAWLDLAPEGVSKASALERVRERLGVSPDATVAVGDGRNDLEMFAWAGLACAMGQAPPEVRAAAGQVLGDVDDDGLVPLLDSLLRR